MHKDKSHTVCLYIYIYIYIYTWIYENQVALSKGPLVTLGTGFLSFKNYLQSRHYKN